MSHFSALRLVTVAGFLSVLFQLSACGGGDGSAASVDTPTGRSSAALPVTSEPHAQPDPGLIEQLEASGRINAKELQVASDAAASAPPMSATASTKVAPTSASSLVPIYRFINTRTASHFYTASLEERNNVIASLPWLQYEGIAFYASTKPARGLSPVHRFYNTQTGVHLYSISESEKTNIEKNIPSFKYEGIAYYASQITAAGTTGLRRFFVRDRGFHFYSSSPEETARIRATLPNYVDEGPAYFALTEGWTAPVDVNLMAGNWTLTSRDNAGTSWSGTVLSFTEQLERDGYADVKGSFNFLRNGSPSGREDFTGKFYADGRLVLLGYYVTPGYGLVTGDYLAYLNVEGNQFLNGSWVGAGNGGIPGTWTASR